jgi:hypothetical protein
MRNTQDQINRWRARAEELRTIANQFEMWSARESLRRTAANCDMLADHAEALLPGQPPVEIDEAAC